MLIAVVVNDPYCLILVYSAREVMRCSALWLSWSSSGCVPDAVTNSQRLPRESLPSNPGAGDLSRGLETTRDRHAVDCNHGNEMSCIISLLMAAVTGGSDLLTDTSRPDAFNTQHLNRKIFDGQKNYFIEIEISSSWLFTTNWTGSCHFDKFWCTQWREFRQNDDVGYRLLSSMGSATLQETYVTFFC